MAIDLLHDVLPYVAGIGGVVVGSFGLNQARKARREAAASNLIAREANDISLGANAISKEANEIARGSVERQTERHDVDWNSGWLRPGLYQLTNVGRDTAYDVHFQIEVDDWVERVDVNEVPPNQPVRIAFDEAGVAHDAEQKAGSSMRLGGGYMPIINAHWIRDRITWVTKLGSPRLHDETHKFSSLGP